MLLHLVQDVTLPYLQGADLVACSGGRGHGEVRMRGLAPLEAGLELRDCAGLLWPSCSLSLLVLQPQGLCTCCSVRMHSSIVIFAHSLTWIVLLSKSSLTMLFKITPFGIPSSFSVLFLSIVFYHLRVYILLFLRFYVFI